MSHSFIGDDMIMATALLLLHLLLYKCIRSTNMSVSSHTTRTDLPKSDNEMACCLIRMLASSCDILDTVIDVITVIKVSKTGRYSLCKVGVNKLTWNLLKLRQRTSYVPLPHNGKITQSLIVSVLYIFTLKCREQRQWLYFSNKFNYKFQVQPFQQIPRAYEPGYRAPHYVFMTNM